VSSGWCCPKLLSWCGYFGLTFWWHIYPSKLKTRWELTD
jgi:hypothetical protein